MEQLYVVDVLFEVESVAVVPIALFEEVAHMVHDHMIQELDFYYHVDFVVVVAVAGY